MGVPAQLSYELEGLPNGEVVVLSNSLGTTRQMWEPQIGPLGRHFRLLLYDPRGHGRSAVPKGPYALGDLGQDLLGLLDSLSLERVSFVGLSLGAMTGMWLAIDAPERIERLILASCAARLKPKAKWTDRAALARGGRLSEIAVTASQRWFTTSIAKHRAAVVSTFEAMIAETPPESYAGCCEALRDYDLRNDLHPITAPTLVIAGAEDPTTKVAHAREVAGAIEGAQLQVIHGAAHLVNVEQAHAFNGAVLAHLAPSAVDAGAVS